MSENKTTLTGLTIWDGIADDYLAGVDSLTMAAHKIESIGRTGDGVISDSK